MVVRTPPLHSLKRGFGLLPKVHQPLPLSERESQQLLDSITQSFRKNLDEEHPWQQKLQQYQKQRPQNKMITATTTKDRPTDEHINTILSNPLFANPETRTTELPAEVTRHLEVFDSALAKGLMTVPRATGFLARLLPFRSQLALTKDGPGRRVVRWLRASGEERKMLFLANPQFMWRLVLFMQDEGLGHIAWEWLAVLANLNESRIVTNLANTPLHILMSAMMRTARSPSPEGIIPSMDTSYSNWLRASKLLSSSDPLTSQIKKVAWSNLSWFSTCDVADRPKSDTSLFESYVDWGRQHGHKRELDVAHLELHHPTSPNHEDALRYLHNRENLVLETVDSYLRMPQRIPREVYVAMDTAARLKNVGEVEEVSFMNGLLTEMAQNLRLDTLRPNDLENIWVRVFGSRPVDDMAHA